jgi:peptidoglycan/LPS O-acetylase OafA/YrhL
LFIPFQKSNGLFQPVLFIGWTINYEMYFYMLLGLAILIAPRRPLLIASIFILGIAGVGSFFTSTSAIASFYSNPVILEFVFGLLAYTCVAAFPERARAQGKYLWIGIVASSLILLPVIESFNLFPSLPLVVRYGPLSFLLISCSCLLAIGGNDLRAAFIVLIGDASYTLYLVHAYFEMVLDRIVARRLPWLHITTAFGCLFAVTVAVIASIYLFLYVEKPMLRYLNKKLCGRARDLRPNRVAAPQIAPQSVTTQTATAPPALAGIQNLT